MNMTTAIPVYGIILETCELLVTALYHTREKKAHVAVITNMSLNSQKHIHHYTEQVGVTVMWYSYI